MNSGKIVVGTTLAVITAIAGLGVWKMQPRNEAAYVEVVELGMSDASERLIEGSDSEDVTAALISQPTDNEHIAPKTTVDSFEKAISTIEILKNQILDLQDQIDSLSEARMVDYQIAEARTQSEQQSAEQYNQTIDVVFEETYKALHEEEYDANWSEEIQTSISSLIEMHELSDVFVRNLNCGSTLCVITLKQNTPGSGSISALLERLSKQDIRIRARDIHTSDVTSEIEVLVGRNGRVFGAKNKRKQVAAY